MSNVFDVAKYILSALGEVSTMKLQKLCYYSLVEGLISPKHVAILLHIRTILILLWKSMEKWTATN